MRRYFKYLILFLLTNATICLSKQASETYRSPAKKVVFIQTYEKSSDNLFYNAAFNYFSSSNEYTIVQNPENLESIISYLNSIKGSKVSEIHIVSHGSHWSGVSLPLNSQILKITGGKLVSSLATRPQISSGVYTKDISLTIHGCGLGRNKILESALIDYFTDTNGLKPQVYLPKGYVFFYPTASKGIISYNRSEVPFYEVTLPSKTYATNQLINIFKTSFPESNIDWRTAFERTNKDFLKFPQASSTRNLSIESFGYKSDIKQFNKIESYLNKHSGIQNQLKEFNASTEQFSWIVEKTSNPLVLKIYGKATSFAVFDSSFIKNKVNNETQHNH